MTPFEIEIILHHYGSRGPFPRMLAPLYEPTVAHLVDVGLLDREDFPAVTDQGRAYVAMLMATPLPTMKWVDPRDNGFVEEGRPNA
jgi:hypothetical protein